MVDRQAEFCHQEGDKTYDSQDPPPAWRDEAGAFEGISSGWFVFLLCILHVAVSLAVISGRSGDPPPDSPIWARDGWGDIIIHASTPRPPQPSLSSFPPSQPHPTWVIGYGYSVSLGDE